MSASNEEIISYVVAVSAETFVETSATYNKRSMQKKIILLFNNCPCIVLVHDEYTRIRQLRLKLCRNMIRRIDFRVMLALHSNVWIEYSPHCITLHMKTKNQYYTKVFYINTACTGGGKSVGKTSRSKTWVWREIQAYSKNPKTYKDTDTFLYTNYVPEVQCVHDECVYIDLPTDIMFERLNAPALKLILTLHGIDVTRQKVGIEKLHDLFVQHTCTSCPQFYSEFKSIPNPIAERSKKSKHKHAEQRQAEGTKLSISESEMNANAVENRRPLQLVPEPWTDRTHSCVVRPKRRR